MNAYELANRLQEIYEQCLKANCWDDSIQYATTMLRQQADRIAELEEENKQIRERTWDSDFARKFLSEIREAKEKQGAK